MIHDRILSSPYDKNKNYTLNLGMARLPSRNIGEVLLKILGLTLVVDWGE